MNTRGSFPWPTEPSYESSERCLQVSLKASHCLRGEDKGTPADMVSPTG